MSDEEPVLRGETHIGRVALRVADLERQTEFYRDVVGLAVRESDDERAILGTDNGPLLELIADPDAPERAPEQIGLFHTAFLVPTRAALGDALERVRTRWQLSGAADHLASEALYLSDPEGNGIEIYRDRPREEWERTETGGVRLDTLPLDLEELESISNGRVSVPRETTVGHVHLEISSLEASRAYYVGGIGMGVQYQYDGALFVAAGDYHHHVGLNTWRGRSEPAIGGGEQARTLGLEWVELVVPDRQSLEDLKARLSAQGREITTEDHGDQSAFSTRDPDEIAWRVRAAGN
ncbi:VOC family protein [Natronoglomus mannanivorans]|uniref:VOC family protein n=1 Tax=Natronoglomus mannanivorans TaxID=2979990 RepID=A0AAP2Z1S7_9EURY|nr:VOC family protein [Halobacteria archaeon AArc-xg1-1]